LYTTHHYRIRAGRDDLVSFRLIQHESDIEVHASSDLTYVASRILGSCRRELMGYIRRRPEFMWSFSPIPHDPNAPETARWMISAAFRWNVGPMAAVAGALARKLGEELACHTDTVIVENGGDIYVIGSETIFCALYAGKHSPFSGRFLFEVDAADGMGICTSSGTVGHSFSMGNADAVTVVASDAAEADAAATAIANRISKPSDITEELEILQPEHGLTGVIACCGDRLATRNMRLIPTSIHGREA